MVNAAKSFITEHSQGNSLQSLQPPRFIEAYNATEQLQIEHEGSSYCLYNIAIFNDFINKKCFIIDDAYFVMSDFQLQIKKFSDGKFHVPYSKFDKFLSLTDYGDRISYSRKWIKIENKTKKEYKHVLKNVMFVNNHNININNSNNNYNRINNNNINVGLNFM